MLFKNTVKSFLLRLMYMWKLCLHFHACLDFGPARPDKLSVDLNDTGITGLDRSKGFVVTDLGHLFIDFIH